MITGEDVRRRRLGLGLTQEELAALLTATKTTVARWERGERTISHPGMLALALDALEERATKAASIAFWEETQGEAACPCRGTGQWLPAPVAAGSTIRICSCGRVIVEPAR